MSIEEIKEEIEFLFSCISEAGNLPEDEKIYNQIEDLEKLLKQ